MLRFTILAVLFAAVCAGLINDKLKNADLDVTVVDNFDDYLAENPEVELLEQLVQEEVRDRNQIKYTLGNHVNGDRLVAAQNYNQKWAKPTNVKAKLNYPSNGVGSIVSFVLINADQSSNVGRAFVTYGGIGQRRIQVTIESNQTTYFRYNAQIYGHN